MSLEQQQEMTHTEQEKPKGQYIIQRDVKRMEQEIKSKFKYLRDRNPYWSDFICFAKSVENQGYPKRVITKMLGKLAKDDYFLKDKDKVVNGLWNLSKGKNRGR